MCGIDKKACRQFLEPVLAPSPECGLFLLSKLKYVIRTAVKIVGHRRLLILCLYARGDTPGDRPKLTYTMFQASDGFITYGHRAETKTRWRTAMYAAATSGQRNAAAAKGPGTESQSPIKRPCSSAL